MKKVVSALTAAAMCASMAAGVMSVFAAYTSEEVAFSLEVISTGNYTVEGNTITFATAEDAQNATFTVAEYIEADPSKADVTQVATRVITSDASVVLADECANLTNKTYNAEAVTYTLSDGTEFSTKLYVSCFGYLNARGAYQNGTGMFQIANESTISDYDSYYTPGTSQLAWTWMYSFTGADTATANFLGSTSDEFPLTQFDVTLAADITDGTYTIDFLEKFDTQSDILGIQDATYIMGADGAAVLPTLKPLTIKVGDATAEETTEAEQEDTTEAEQEDTTEAGSEGNENNTPSGDAYAWDIDDVTADPGETVPVYIYAVNDTGCVGYTFQVLVDGESISASDLVCDEISQGDMDYNCDTYADFDLFVPNGAELMVASANQTATENSVAVEGAPIVTMWITVPEDAAPGTVYNLTFNDAETTISDVEKNECLPELVAGSITVNGETEPEETEPEETEPEETDPVETEPEETEPEETEPEETEPEETEPQETVPVDPNYLYGDVNENGVVELVDIVLFNRALVGYNGESVDGLNDYQKEVANCYYDSALDGKDSIEILKYLIGTNDTLPTAAQ